MITVLAVSWSTTRSVPSTSMALTSKQRSLNASTLVMGSASSKKPKKRRVENLGLELKGVVAKMLLAVSCLVLRSLRIPTPIF